MIPFRKEDWDPGSQGGLLGADGAGGRPDPRADSAELPAEVEVRRALWR